VASVTREPTQAHNPSDPGGRETQISTPWPGPQRPPMGRDPITPSTPPANSPWPEGPEQDAGAVTDGVVLICPPGSEQAPISHGPDGYWAWHHQETNHWLVRVPAWTVEYFCHRGAGFVVAPDELQREEPP
jgi:hypothetical protein